MSIYEIRKLSNLSQTAFCKKYGIPLSTLKKWEAAPGTNNHRNCPDYVIKLLLRAVTEDNNIP